MLTASAQRAFDAVATPWVELPSQTVRRPDTSEKRLLIAILQDAIEVIRKGEQRLRGHKGLTGPTVYTLAVDWMRSESREWCCAYEVVCEILGYDADAVRRAVGV